MDSEYPSSHTSSRPEEQQQHQPNTSELFGSAKLLGEAAQSTFTHQSDKIDKGRAAGAAADLLDAASHYGKLEGSSVGQYLEKAENYLHKYGSSHSSSGHPAAAAETHHAPAYSGEGGEEKEAGSGGYGEYKSHSANAPAHGSAHSVSEEDSGSGGYGNYIKMAQGFLGSGGGAHSESGGGHGGSGHSTEPSACQGSAHSGGEEDSGSGGYGNYVKMAQGFLGSGGEEKSGSGGGYGEYVKMAQGFLKKD